MATSYEPRTDLADRLMTRTQRGPKVGFGSALFRRLGIADPFAGGDVADAALTQPRFDFLSSRAYLAELRGLSRRRLMLIDRISGIRSALRSHNAFQQRVATPAVRAASLGMDSGTLIDWSSQIEDDVEAEEEAPGAAGLADRRRTEEAGLRETAATRALKSEIAQASGVLAQLQRLLDTNRGTSDRALNHRLAALERSQPAQREGAARKLARELRGVAAVARRGTELGERSSSLGERPLAVAQARQAEGDVESKGLRRVLGESPVIMTLEEPEPTEATEEVAPPTRRSARPSLEPRVSRDAHAGRVARAATEARSQASAGRAGPPATPASAQPAARVAEAPQRIARAQARPTQRIARAAKAATQAPLNDTRRGLQAVEAPRVSSRSAARPLTRDVAPRISGPAARSVLGVNAPAQASSEVTRPITTASPEMVGIDAAAEEDGEELADSGAASSGASRPVAPRSTIESRQAPPTASTPHVEGIARIAARTEAGTMDATGRVTGATRYLTPELASPAQERRIVVEHADGRFRSLDLAATETRPMALAAAVPSMAMPESESAMVEESDDAAPAARATRPATVTPATRPAPRATSERPTPASTPVRAVERSAPSNTTPARVEATRGSGTPMRSVARAMQRSQPTSTQRSIAVARPAVQPARIERQLTDVAHSPNVSAPSATTRPRTQALGAPAVVRPAPGTPARGALQTAVASQDAPRAAASSATGIRRRSRALPTVRAAARTLSQERWGARGRMLSPAVSRFVEAESFEQVVEQAQVRGSTRAAEIPSAVADAMLALPTAPESEESESAQDTVRATPRARPVAARPEPAAPAQLDAAVGPAARAVERSMEHPRVVQGRTLASPRVVAPFRDEPAAAPTSRLAAREQLVEELRGARSTDDGVAPNAVTDAPKAARDARTFAPAPTLITALPEGSEVAEDEVVAGSVARATRRGSEIVPAARRSLLPQATPELQQAEARRVVARTEQRLGEAGEPSPFRAPSTRAASVAAPLDPVLVRSVADDHPTAEVADAVGRANARAERPAAARAQRSAAAPGLPGLPGIDSYAHALPSLADAPSAERAASRGAPSTAVESPVARAVRRSESSRNALAASPVTSARSFVDEVASVQAPRSFALAPETVFAEHAIADVDTQAPQPGNKAVPSQRAHTGTRRAVASRGRAPSTVRALGRSRARRDLRSVVPHPVGTPRTARASARMLDRAPGAIAAPEAVLVRPDEVVDLASAPTSPSERSLPLAQTIAARAAIADQPASLDRVADRAEGVDRVEDSSSVRPRSRALVDGMTLAEAWSDAEPGDPARTEESVAGGRRAVGRLPGQDRSRFAPRKPESAVMRAAIQDVLQNANVLRAAERGDDPVVSVPGVRRAAGLREDRSTRFEARVRSTGRGVETVVVDTLTGEQIRTAGPTTLPEMATVPSGEVDRPTPVQRAEKRDAAVETVAGRPRTSLREALAPQTLAQPQAEQEIAGRAPLAQTFSELLEGRATDAEAGRPLMRRRTWNRRQLAHELGEFAPAMSEAEFLEAPTASEEAPAWARRAVTGTGVQRPQTRGPAARADRGAPQGVTVEDGVERAYEPNSLIGALSRADGPEELIKVIVERRSEVRTVRETLPVEAVRIVERLATLSPEEAAVLQGPRTLQAQPRTNLAGPRRGSGQGFTQLSGANDGHGANQVMKLADKLRNLIHLAENQRLADAHRELQMSQAAAKASSAAFEDPRGPGQSPDAQTMNMQKLQDDVWKSLQKQFEKLKTQMGDL